METNWAEQIVLPRADSHKGQNGRVLVIGGSKLFHAASFWAAATAARVVDIVHFSSPAMENNELMRKRAKEKFWEGIVVPWEDVEHYIEEDDAILIGPGMPRDEGLLPGEKPTEEIVNSLLKKYPEKKWVVDGGALQEVEPKLINGKMIITPNQRELELLFRKTGTVEIESLAQELGGVTILAKGVVDTVSNGDDKEEVKGGNAGMTKGGTGDVLAGLVVGLYAKSPAMAAAAVASTVNKRVGEQLAEKAGTFFGASEMMAKVAEELFRAVGSGWN